MRSEKSVEDKSAVKAINADNFALTCSNMISGVISFFIFLLVTVFPLIYHDSYFDILETKYKCYYLCIVGMLLVCLILSLVMLFIDWKEYKGIHAKALLMKLSPQCWKDTFCAADFAVIIFWIVALISTLQSDYVFEAFWGNEGRYTGLFLMTLYVLSYFAISRFWKVKGWLLELFLVSGMIMSIIGITDYFQLDILNFRSRINPEQRTLFISTVGNINTYTAYIALVMGFAAASFASTKNKWKSVWYLICLVISFLAIITGCSDNAYLALGALFAFLPFILFRSWSGMFRYLVIIASFFSVAQLVDWINHTYENMVIGLNSLFGIIANFSALPIVVAGLWILVVVIYIYASTTDKLGKELGRLPIQVWTVIILCGAAAVLFVLYDANIAGNSARYEMVKKYVVFDDSWGTSRGYIWRKSLELYRDFEGMHKLFGYGPDTFGILTTFTIREDMVTATKQIFDNAHNEYLHFLITIGPIGTISYIAFISLSFIEFCKKYLKHPCVLGCAAAVLCYSAQALVNLNLPIATPMLWLMLSGGMAAIRGKVKEE